MIPAHLSSLPESIRTFLLAGEEAGRLSVIPIALFPSESIFSNTFSQKADSVRRKAIIQQQGASVPQSLAEKMGVQESSLSSGENEDNEVNSGGEKDADTLKLNVVRVTGAPVRYLILLMSSTTIMSTH